MVRRSFVWRVLFFIALVAAFYLIVNLFINTKTWGDLAMAAVGFCLLPVLATIRVRTLNILPASKVVIISAVWVAWVVLAGIASFAAYYYWNNNYAYTINGGCPGGLCAGPNSNPLD